VSRKKVLNDDWILNENTIDDGVEFFKSGKISLSKMLRKVRSQDQLKVRRLLLEKINGNQRGVVLDDNEVVKESLGKNCENVCGVCKVPQGVVGPIKWNEEEQFAFLATTEGALVASVSRGVKCFNKASKVEVKVEKAGVTRSLVFRVDQLKEAEEMIRWIDINRELIKGEVERTSRYLRLLDIKTFVVGRQVYVKIFGDAGEAMGMNMITVAAEALASLIEEKLEIKCLSLSGNMCVDKKPASINMIEGRGLKVWVEGVVEQEQVKKMLKAKSEDIYQVVKSKQWLGGMMAGSYGFNAHYANVVAAFFLATGQDIAHVVEGSLGITTAEVNSGDLYFSIYMPAVMIGSVGGGTGLPTQKNSLKMMGFDGKKGDKVKLVKLLGILVWAGELSLTGALAGGDLAKAHKALGR
jgi:hydroxymethylglutaryl-CoA reductase (NADPH)